MQFLVETVASGDILQFKIDFKMVALTEASTVLHGLLRQRLVQQRSSACHPHDEAVREGRRDPSMGPSPQPLVLSIVRLLASHATLIFLHSRVLQAHFYKPFTVSLPNPLLSLLEGGSSPPTLGCGGAPAPAQPPGTWQPRRMPGLRFPAQQK